MRIIGIDPGTAKMGLCRISGTVKQPVFDCSLVKTEKTKSIDTKFQFMVATATQLISDARPDLVVCEYPFSIQGHAKVLVEMFGAIRYHCLVNDYEFLALSQSRIKKYATGVGKDVEKSAMVMRAFKEYGLDLSDDESDAFWIAHVGMTYSYGSPVKFRQDSVDDIRKKAGEKLAKRTAKKRK
jgi:Holliday junction resolvasome RuvABC endonuclease subunit